MLQNIGLEEYRISDKKSKDQNPKQREPGTHLVQSDADIDKPTTGKTPQIDRVLTVGAHQPRSATVQCSGLRTALISEEWQRIESTVRSIIPSRSYLSSMRAVASNVIEWQESMIE